ncbi:MAG: P1 family peptidase, partial [Tissierellia bacterium]|nr:P1 family peptidase [Tissierellia bacterium]
MNCKLYEGGIIIINQKRIQDYGINIGEFPKGKLNKITDVKGVKVGHSTIDTKESKTGVTVILPMEENIFSNKLIGASYVLNGFGKTTGLVQIEELGTLESIIA